ncbi:hypothetical protein EV664_11578 [Stakelama pacifica]|uniref:Uncharacterized protein n=1 Tax=Stakelama pacifica TaxID=517720 RepID=A0A4R6FEP4_9SPHN|nr:hypothetical protein EV664_11578 [Stakelama pacifica]
MTPGCERQGPRCRLWLQGERFRMVRRRARFGWRGCRTGCGLTAGRAKAIASGQKCCPLRHLPGQAVGIGFDRRRTRGQGRETVNDR